MSLPLAIVIAGLALGLGIGCGIGFMFYYLYRIFCVLSAALTGNPVSLRRAMEPVAKKPTQPEKTVADIPELGLHALSENPKAIAKLRKKQDSSDTSSNY